MSIRLLPNEIVKTTGGRFISGIGLTMIDGIHVDDRQVTPGSLFVPLKGSRHASVEKAFQKGAVAALISSGSGVSSRTLQNNPKKIFIEVDDAFSALAEMALFWKFKLGISFLSIIGNKNSAAVKELCFKIISQSTETAEAPGSIVTGLDLSLYLFGLHAGIRRGILGITTGNPDETERLVYNSEPSVLVVTDTTQKDIKLLTKIIGTLDKKATLVLNSDDAGFAALKKAAPCRVLSFGTKKADICTGKVKKTKDGTVEFALTILKENTEIKAKDVAVPDALAAAAAAYASGLEIEEIKKGLEE